MLKKGWLNKVRDPDNAKMVRVSLTARGRAKLEAVQHASDKSPAEPFDPMSCFTNAEHQQFDALLNRLHEHLATRKDKEEE